MAYWRDGFDWREQEQRINALPQFQTVADGREPHFVHARSSRPDALPLLPIHGWPGSFWEFHRIVPLLTDPGARGGDPRDAFHGVAIVARLRLVGRSHQAVVVAVYAQPTDSTTKRNGKEC